MVKRILFAISAAALLAGCGTAGDTSHVDTAATIVYKTVDVPVPQACPALDNIGARPGDAKTHGLSRPLPADPGALVDLLLAKLKEWDGPGKYADKVDDAKRICKPPAAPAVR